MENSNGIKLHLTVCDNKFHIFNSMALRGKKLSSYYKFDFKKSPAENLTQLSLESLDSRFTTAYLFIYQPIFIDIVSRWISEKDTLKFVTIIDCLGRVITLSPEVTSLIEFYISSNGHVFNAILQTESSDPTSLHKILLAYYRFLYHDKYRFSKYVNPEIFHNLLIRSSDTLIKYLCIKVLSMYLDMSESAYTKFTNIHIENNGDLIGHYEGNSHSNYKFLELNEAKRFSNFSKLLTLPVDNHQLAEAYYIDPYDLSSHVTSLCGILVPKLKKEGDVNNEKVINTAKVMYTDKSICAMRHLSKSIQKSQPVMVIGKAGSGKTFIIDQLSRFMGCDGSIVKIHLSSQTDVKLLLGTYTSGERPGTFEWRSGVLTTAVKEGMWVLIEDIDKAPTEVLSVLLTLLEKRELTIPSRGEVIKASNGFQLISTIRMGEDCQKDHEKYIPDMIGIRLWEVIELEEPSDADLINIISDRYSMLTNMAPIFIKTYKSVKAIYNSPQFISLNRGIHPRIVSIRDLIKLCTRVSRLLANNNIITPHQLMESSIYDGMFAEAVDCFAGAISEFHALEPLIKTIGETLEIPTVRINLFLTKHVPVFEEDHDIIRIGRAILPKYKLSIPKKSVNLTSFARTNHSLKLMEQIGVAIQMCEPLLLVGETGTGKTTVVQQVAKLMNKPLTVINVSQQTESSDLLGGYKPINCKTLAISLQEEFESLFVATFSLKKNEKFYKILHKCFNKSQWKNLVKLWNEAFKMANISLSKEDISCETTTKKKRKLDHEEKQQLLDKWMVFSNSVKQFELKSNSIENSFVFDFIEGSLVKAVRNGEWLLLDEINLAPADTLESITDLLTDVSSRSIVLSEKGEVESVKVHADFRIITCMNPATDVGKKDLPAGIRSKFTELYVHSPDKDITDLLSIIDRYIGRYSVSDEWVGNDIAQLYIEAKNLAESNKIVDGSNQKPHFSIRTLTRAIVYVCDIIQIYGLRRSLYEGFCMCFLTLLDETSESLLKPIIEKYTLGRLKNSQSVLAQIPSSPGPGFVKFKHYWMKCGPEEIQKQSHYIITPYVERNILNLVRATSTKRFPVLVQGPTSAGKTSMIKYLADITGHKFVRINNHEHTDLQEYLGTYITDDTGKLFFREGILVEALRKGYWIVLDELNLAPTDVLEALNRLLDDNRELFIPETQEVIHPHPNFMLFATQNPPGIYGGRKMLSRAFRNRFLELHFDDIPQDELEIILRERCQIAPSYARKIVEVYRQLSIQRSSNRIFEQKNSFATLRDLFRWAHREAVGYEQLAANGYMLLAEKCRNSEEKLMVKSVLEKVMKVQLDMDSYYTSLEDHKLLSFNSPIIWTKGMRRLAVLVQTCIQNNEPILLVGETGCGKTTVCQLISQYWNKNLITINAHQNTETGDILGAQRPVRNRSDIQAELYSLVKDYLNINSDEYNIQELLKIYDAKHRESLLDSKQNEIKRQRDSLNILFEWCDGPLVNALKTGDFFLLDEISLADDSVLERLNSVLEPERSLLLAEKGTSDSFITAKEGFEFFATMNPGGDYGKKELSPALRNRFTEIWVPSMEDFEDITLIVHSKLSKDVKNLTNPIVKFSEWYGNKFGGGNTNNGVISLRDILSWVEFVNSTYLSISNNNIALLHGASMVFIDSLGTNNTSYLAENSSRLQAQKIECIQELSKLVDEDLLPYITSSPCVEICDNILESGPFKLIRSSNSIIPSFNMDAPTTATNLMRVIRAMQVHKPILLEGSPGVGKTSLISSLSECTGNKLTRINLSEQTDLIDLFGSDVPGENAGEFTWYDAPFLRAMQQGEWVLLDEMNLASQSVLEGLNACLDHRGEVYIPELDKSFTRHPNFVVFAAQNPQYQGGGRKGLPKSFINRFSVVYVDMLSPNDLLLISKHLYPNISPEICEKMIQLMSILEEEINHKKLWGSSGSPWEFNLRDILRWLKLLDTKSISEDIKPYDFLNIIVTQRFRDEADCRKAQILIETIFGKNERKDNYYQLGKDYLQVNGEIIKRHSLIQYSNNHNLVPLQSNFNIYESVIRCINFNWPVILVGPTNSGKSEIIKFLSSITGAKVLEFSMNSDVDSTDILGGYEQVDLTRKISYVVEELITHLRELLIVNFSSQTVYNKGINLALSLYYFLSLKPIIRSNFIVFEEYFKEFMCFMGDDNMVFQQLSKKIQNLSSMILKDEVIKFEWFDGLLVKAVEQGNWLILDNANLCSPSVLDRLNSLLETNGSLIINECGLENNRLRIIKPHPNFRLFLTVDPKYGELSRAMRNRGVELFVDDLNQRTTTFDRLLLGYSHNDISNNLTVDFKDISFQDHKQQFPMSKFIPSNNSFILPFVKFHDIVLLSTSELSNSLASTFPLISGNDIILWEQNTVSISEYDEYNTVSNFSAYYKFLVEVGIFDKLKVFYNHIPFNTSEIFGNTNSFNIHQPLIPILNGFISYTLHKHGLTFLSSELIYLFELLDLAYSSFEKLEFANKKSTHGKINELTYLEQSSAVINGRNIQNPPKIPIYNFLLQLNNYVIHQLRSIKLFESNGAYKLLSKLYSIWLGAFNSSYKRDEARLRVYQELFEDFIKDNKSYIPNLDIMVDIAKEFGSSLSLTTGTSMTLLWEAFRPRYPSNLTEWNKHGKILHIAQNFDKVVADQFTDSYSLIHDLREALIKLYDEILSGLDIGFDFVIDKLQNGINEVSTISGKFLNKRKHFFREEFDTLCRLLFQKHTDTLAVISDISSNSTISTEMLIKIRGNLYPYPPVFDFMWIERGNQFESFVSTVMGSSLLQSIIKKVCLFQTFAGSQIKQALQDVELLKISLIRSSNFITQDPPQTYKSILMSWYYKIVDGHLSIDSSNLTLETILKNIEESSDLNFKAVHEKFLLPAIIICTETSSNILLGKAWVLFSAGLIQLYVPSSSYDPAFHDYVVYDNYMIQKSLSEKLVFSWKQYRTVNTGDSKLLIEKLIDVISDSDAPKKPRVFRPETSIDFLFDEWSAFMSSTVDICPLENLLKSLEEDSKMLSSKISMFQQNTSQFLKRLKFNYVYYSDLNDIFAGYVLGLKFGFELIMSSKIDEERILKVSPLWPVDIHTITDINQLQITFEGLSPYLKNNSIESLDVEMIMSFFLRILKNHKKNKNMIPIFNSSLRLLYYRWSLRRIKNEQKIQEQGNLFRYQDQSDDVEADFKKLFPDYDDVLTIEASSENHICSSNIDDIYYEIAQNYINIFNTHEDSISDIINYGSKISSLLLKNQDEFRSHMLTGHDLSSVISIISHEMNLFNTHTCNEDFDFYRGYSILETNRAVEIVKKVWNSINELLKEWPEHATLRELFRICQEFLEFAVNTPVARLLQKIEQIYTFVIEWEKYASSKVSLKSHIFEITTLIVSWRRLELRTWNSLFNFEDRSIKQNIGKWWFHLFEIIIVTNFGKDKEDRSNQEENTNLLSSLNIFFSKSTYGEFNSRLELLKAFTGHVKLLSDTDLSILHSLYNTIRFYEQFKPIIKEHIENGRKVLEKEMSDLILLASWKDVNIDALKQSSRRSHASLYKLVRKYRELLSGEISNIIESGLPFTQKLNSTFVKISSPHFLKMNIEEAKVLVTHIPSWNLRSNHLKNISVIERNMEVYSATITNQSIPDICDFARYLMKEANRLRDETPITYTIDNKKLLSTLKTQKRKLLSDAIKELRRIGLKTHFREDVRKIQTTVTYIFSTNKSFKDTELSLVDSYFFRVLDLLPRLKHMTSQPADDIPLADIEKGMAISEDLIFTLITLRDPLFNLSVDFEKLKESRLYLEDISLQTDTLKHYSISFNFSSCKQLCDWLPDIIDFTIQNLQACAKDMNSEVEISFLQDAKEYLITLVSKISKIMVYNESTDVILREFETYIENFLNTLYTYNNSHFSFIYNSLAFWITKRMYKRINKDNNTDITSIEVLDQTLCKVQTLIMLSFQNLMEIPNEPITDDMDLWFLKSKKRVSYYIKNLNSSKIVNCINEVIHLTRKCDFSKEDSRYVSGLITFTMPVINQYFSLVTAVLEIVADNYYKMGKATYDLCTLLYNLAKNGFCSPSPPSEDVNDNNLHEGTGLGDGEGAQNNSNDVEEDENLTENAQQPNKNQDDGNDRNEDDDNDMIDMQGDMEGELEDASDQSDNDEDGDREEVEDEIDKLDEDDPNAIDDKMWDEEVSDNVKEKNSDKLPENSTTEDDQVAKEHESLDETCDDSSKKEHTVEDEENEKSSDADSEDDVGNQNDEIRDGEMEDLEPNVPEIETMDLPEDINLDSDQYDDKEDDSESFEDQMDLDEDFENVDINKEANVTEELSSEENDNYEDANLEEEQGEEQTEEQKQKDGQIEDNDMDEESKSDEELNNDQEVTSNDNGSKNKPDGDVEGLDITDDVSKEQTIDNEAAVQQQSGLKGEGSNIKNEEEEKDVGSLGSAQLQQDQQNVQNEFNEPSRNEIKDTLKQLGDALKEFHKRHQDINEPSSNNHEDLETETNEIPNEFEHLDGVNTESNTQALGSANEDQQMLIDEDNAIDEEPSAEPQICDSPEFHQNDDISMEVDDTELQDGDITKDENNGKSKGAFIGNRQSGKDDEILSAEAFKNEWNDLDEIIEEIDRKVKLEEKSALPVRSLDESRELWRKSEIKIIELAAGLTEQLRLILEPTLTTKLKGDYKTGKRLNMKRIIPYIASQFRKDNIWLRRTKPSKRQYQIMIAVDDSKSMSESKSVELAFQSICLVSKALTQLEAGRLSIVKFGETIQEVHPFKTQFTNEIGAKVFQWFDFQETKTDIKKLVAESIRIFNRAREIENTDLWQLEIIISDGVCEDHETIQRLVRRAREHKIMLVFVIVDGINSGESIMDMSQVKYIPDQFGNPQLKVEKYLDTFPFEFYVVVHDISELPEMLSIILRQYFSELASK